MVSHLALSFSKAFLEVSQVHLELTLCAIKILPGLHKMKQELKYSRSEG